MKKQMNVKIQEGILQKLDTFRKKYNITRGDAVALLILNNEKHPLSGDDMVDCMKSLVVYNMGGYSEATTKKGSSEHTGKDIHIDSSINSKITSETNSNTTTKINSEPHTEAPSSQDRVVNKAKKFESYTVVDDPDEIERSDDEMI